jgi:cytidylate kinase
MIPLYIALLNRIIKKITLYMEATMTFDTGWHVNPLAGGLRGLGGSAIMSRKHFMVVAIDGPAGSGKSTIAEMLARQLTLDGGRHFIYINSGNLYRALTLACIQRGIDIQDEEAVAGLARTINLEYNDGAVFLDGENVNSMLRSDKIDSAVSRVSANIPARHIINTMIQKITTDRDAIVEGRDMTTIVFPDAEARFYLDASAEARARRRYGQGTSKLSIEEILSAIEERDKTDKNKPEGSLKIADGVMYIDSSHLTIKQVYEKLEEIIRLKG